ncbi:MAG: APC family permease [Anaerovoracaceae bacterium]
MSKETKSMFNIEELTAPNHGMKRDMGLFRAVGMMAGLMIGSGIFYVGAFVLDYVHLSTGMALLAWLLAGLMSLCAGLCYAEMGTAMPRSGGSYVYVTESFGPVVGFTMGWSDFWICQTGSIAALGLGFSQYLGSLFGGFSSITTSLVAVATIIVLSLVNMAGVKEGSTLSTVLLVIKVVVIAVVIVSCFTYNGGGGSEIEFGFEGGIGAFVGAISMGVIAALWAFDGWTSICMVAEEVKEPQKNIPRALIITLAGLTVIYLLFNLGIMRVLPADVFATADNATFVAMETIFGTGIAAALTVGILMSILGSANSAILAYPREYYAMARDKRWFPIFGKVDKKSRTPKNSQIITMVYACIICFIADFQSLIDIAVLATWVYYSLAVASCIVLRKKYPNIERPYKVWGYPVLPIVVVIFGVIMLAANFLTDPHTILGLLIPLSGVPAYFVFNKYYEKHEFPEFEEAADLDD